MGPFAEAAAATATGGTEVPSETETPGNLRGPTAPIATHTRRHTQEIRFFFRNLLRDHGG